MSQDVLCKKIFWSDPQIATKGGFQSVFDQFWTQWGNNPKKLHFGLQLSSLLQKLGQGPQKKLRAGNSVCARFFCELGGFLNFLRLLPDMFTPIFFLWEITKKFFYLAYGFHILQLKKIMFMVLGGPNGALGAFWLILGLNRLFVTNFP